MRDLPSLSLLPLLFLLSLSTTPFSLPHLFPFTADQLQTYIVHLRPPNGTHHLLHSPSHLKRWHSSFLPNYTLSSGDPRLLYSYHHAITGFAARLTPAEAKAMEAIDGFLLAHPDRRLAPHTTHTPQFLNLDDWSSGTAAWEKSFYGDGVIVGVVDTGIAPTHPSFSDYSIPPPPIRWRGHCSLAACNNKLIGAKAFYAGHRSVSPLDADGHGTHVSGIAAGNFVRLAGARGMALGTAAGMAPKAHLAVYKACFAGECRDSDVVAAVDHAIHDRVDVLLIPFGGLPLPMYQDSVAAASFAAVGKGIVVCASAGNGGRRGMISHEAPWLVTAGATSVDRRIRATVKLGNGVELLGESAFQASSYEFPPVFLPLYFPGIDGDTAAANCRSSSLADHDLRGKIVLCFAGDEDNTVRTAAARNAAAAAVILMNRRSHGFTTRAEMHELPASHLSYIDGRRLRSYIYSTAGTPVAALVFNGTEFGARPSPAVAAFSSRGPSLMNGGVLKPDIVAPGVNVLSAWPPATVAPRFGFMSGTSMAAAHVAGVAALVRRRHPRWSPAMVQSALITSATNRDLDGNEVFDELSYNSSASFFAEGAGQLNPIGAMNPGFVYDIEQKHYLRYLCGLGYTRTQVWAIAKRWVSCNKTMEAEELNTPSISVRMGPTRTATKSVVRTAKSVRKGDSVYWARIEEPKSVRVDLSRYELKFSRANQEESFEVKLSIRGSRRVHYRGHVSQGRLSWVSRKRVVSIPIVVTFD